MFFLKGWHLVVCVCVRARARRRATFAAYSYKGILLVMAHEFLVHKLLERRVRAFVTAVHKKKEEKLSFLKNLFLLFFNFKKRSRVAEDVTNMYLSRRYAKISLAGTRELSALTNSNPTCVLRAGTTRKEKRATKVEGIAKKGKKVSSEERGNGTIYEPRQIS